MKSSWNELVDEFRSLGGILENITLTRHNGQRGLFPIDRKKMCRLHVPRHLLVPSKDVELINDQLVISETSTISKNAREFFERYARTTSWADGGRTEVQQFFQGLAGLPQATKRILSEDLRLKWWFDPISNDQVLTQFTKARRIGLDGELYLAPMLELSNHDPKGPKIVNSIDGITLDGLFDSEFAWRYALADSFQMFTAYQFPSPERFAFSLPFNVFDKGMNRHINVSNDRKKSAPSADGIPTPLVSNDGNTIDVSFILLGDRLNPRSALASFKSSLAPNLGASGMEFFESLLYFNRSKFLELLASCETCETPTAQMIRKVCRLQIETLNMCSMR